MLGCCSFCKIINFTALFCWIHPIKHLGGSVFCLWIFCVQRLLWLLVLSFPQMFWLTIFESKLLIVGPQLCSGFVCGRRPRFETFSRGALWLWWSQFCAFGWRLGLRWGRRVVSSIITSCLHLKVQIIWFAWHFISLRRSCLIESWRCSSLSQGSVVGLVSSLVGRWRDCSPHVRLVGCCRPCKLWL